MAVTETTEKVSVLNRIQTVSERPSYIKCLIYGEPGVGKTTFAATAPNVLFVDVEHGTNSLLNSKEFNNVQVLSIKDWNDIEELYWELKAGALPEIETIVIDTISELQKLNMDLLLRESAARDGRKDPYVPTQLDYKKNTEVVRRIMWAYRELDRHLIVTAHVKERQDEETSKVALSPDATPKLAGTLGGIVDIQGYLYVEKKEEETKRLLRIQPTDRIKAKTRIGDLPDVIENPTFNILLEANMAKQI